jgi:hypothetical protein
MRSRKFSRIRFKSEAMVMVGKQSFSAVAENLSLDGILLRTERRMPVGNRVAISFNLPSASRSSTITVNGVVVRNDVHGIAFQFRSLDHDSFAHLKTVINRKSPNRLKPHFTA